MLKHTSNINFGFKKYFNFTKNIIHKATITHYDVYANKQYFQCAQNNENVM